MIIISLSFLIKSISPHSDPKQILLTTFKELSKDTAPKAKNSAEEVAKRVGNSTTKSTPASKAIFVLVHLSVKAGKPLCTKFPLITQITPSQFVISFELFR